MAIPTSRQQFKEYCLRKLGHPVIQINVSDDQVEDRIDESISYYYDYHYDGTSKIYYKYQVSEQDIQNRWIPIPDNIIGAVRVFPLSSSVATASGIFNAKYQFVLQNIEMWTKYDLIDYTMAMSHLSLIDELLVGQQPIRFNRHMNKLFIDADWSYLPPGNFVIVEAYQIIDPAEYPDVWKDRWLQNYATAKVKYQWGSNLSKFEGMQLPGGIQFNGARILDEAKEEIQKMEDEMLMSHSIPPSDFIG